MKSLLLVVFISFQCLFWNSLNSQEPYFQKFSFYKGHSFRSVYSILEDKKGFIWFTSDEGLFCYDGTRFKNFKNPEQTSFSGTHIKEDKFGRIWYQTFDGTIYYFEKNQLNQFKTKSVPIFFPIQFIENELYTLEENFITIYDLKSLKPIKRIKNKSTASVTSAIFKGEFYYISGNTLRKITKELKDVYVSDLKVKFVTDLLLCSTKNSLFLIQKSNSSNFIWKITKEKAIKFATIPTDVLVRNFQFIKNKLYLTTSDGLIIYNQFTGKKENAFFPKKNTSGVLYDSKNNLWLSSPDEGLILLSNAKLSRYTNLENNPIRLASNNKELIFTTKNSEVNWYNSKNHSIKREKKSTFNTEGYYLYFNQKDNLLVSGFSDGITYFEELNAKKKHTLKISFKQVIPIDDKYYVGIGTGWAGFFYLPNKKNTNSPLDKYISQLTFSKNDGLPLYRLDTPIFYHRGKTLAYDSTSKTIYLSSSNGLFSWKNGVIKEQLRNKKPIILKSLFNFNNNIIGLKGAKSLIPISLNTTKKLFDPLFKHKDINAVKVQEDKIILQTQNDLLVYKLKTSNQLIEYKKLDISTIEVFDFQIKKDQIWISSTDGLLKWGLNDLVKEKVPGNFVINSLNVRNHLYPLNGTKLKYNQNNVSVDFSVLDYGIKTIDHVYYKLNDDKWQELDLNTQKLNFSALSPNDYTIQFKGLVFGKEVNYSSIRFTIQPPFWSSWWFRILLVVLVGLFLYLYYRYQINSLIVKNKLINDKILLENKLNKSMITALKTQMNPHFFYNALNSIQGLVLTGEQEKASASIGLFSDLSRSVLESSRKNEISLYDEIELLYSYLKLEQMRMPKINYSIIFSDDLPLHDIYIPPMILQPLVENSVKHGLANKENGGTITINFEITNERLYIEIKDDGIGRNASQKLNNFSIRKGSSFSTEANMNRIELLNECYSLEMKQEIIDLVDENNHPIGTLVKIIIPQTDN